ncbi:acetylcholine receptor subunit beta-like 1 [Panonychus citri]|uniref:acetylcholine receptor subunit beta-like 1 n=1 Tax=Panonychus citri TaxID=50023 RepID=UPI002307EE5F|nr:acetylcholine receptor subunit beta-like 1 [Panonychus citri]
MRPSPLNRLTTLWMLFLSSFLLYTFPLLCLLFFRTILCSDAEEKLVRDLFRDYNKLIRPVELINKTVEVRFVMYLIQLINVNEKNQVMTTNVWLELRWNDYQFKWDPADYGGIKVLRLPADKVWKPDLVLFNNADGNYEVRFKSNVLISENSEVQWVPPAIYQSSCKIDVTYFPFDQQKCEMKFSSWTFNGDQVSLSFYADPWVDLSDYSKSGTWDIVEVPGILNVYNNSKFNKPTETDITFHITIRRKTLFYTVNLILPTLLISFLCILVFYLPAEAGEKVTLGISILLSLVVFLLLVSKILPPTSLVLPLIAKYLLFTFIMNCISILVTVVILNWNFRGPRTHRMPDWIRVIFLNYLPMFLYMKRPKRTRLRWMMDMPSLGVHYHPSRVPHARGNNSNNNNGNGNVNNNNNHQQQHHHHLRNQNAHRYHHHYPSSSSSINHHHHQQQLTSSTIQNRMTPSPTSVNMPPSPLGSTGEGQPHGHHGPHHHHHHHPLNRFHHHHQQPISPRASKSVLENLEMSDLGGEGNILPPPPPPLPPPPSHLINSPIDLNISQSSYEQFSGSPVGVGQSSPTNLNYRPNYLGDQSGDRSSSSNNLPQMSKTYQQHYHNQQISHAQSSTTNNNNRGKLNENETSIDNQSIDMICLSSAASKATEAIEFIAEHLRAEDEYIQIREDWKYVAMVIDRFQLYLFFLGTLTGTLCILLDAPHIFEYVDQDAVIANHTSKTLA